MRERSSCDCMLKLADKGVCYLYFLFTVYNTVHLDPQSNSERSYHRLEVKMNRSIVIYFRCSCKYVFDLNCHLFETVSECWLSDLHPCLYIKHVLTV